MHLSRYVHLNPYTSAIIKSIEDIEKYPWSSYLEYLQNKHGVCDKEVILSQFKKIKYKSFVEYQADYQRRLGLIKHLSLE